MWLLYHRLRSLIQSMVILHWGSNVHHVIGEGSFAAAHICTRRKRTNSRLITILDTKVVSLGAIEGVRYSV